MASQKKIFIFIGPPGSGKGSLSKLCMQKFGWKQLSTGNLCRRHVKKESNIGKKIDFAIKSGKLISDSLVAQMITKWFFERQSSSFTVILDGYPRTVAQALFFDDFVKKNIENLKLQVIKLEISDDVVVKRLCCRWICQNSDCQAVYSLKNNSLNFSKKLMTCDFCSAKLGRRSDDKESVIKKRLKAYYKYEQSILNFYRAQRRCIQSVDVNKTLDEVFENFKRLVNVKFCG